MTQRYQVVPLPDGPSALDQRRAPVRITIIDPSHHHHFQHLLCQVATAALSPADIALARKSQGKRSPLDRPRTWRYRDGGRGRCRTL